MRRIGSFLILIFTVVMLSGSFAWADGDGSAAGGVGAGHDADKKALKIVSIYPEDGKSGFQPVNMPVKIEFNKDVSAKGNQPANIKAMKLTTKKGEEIPIKVIFHPEEKNKVMVLTTKKELKNNTTYVFEINDGFKASDGTHLDKKTTTTFTTRDAKKDSRGNMLMMGLMVAAIVLFSMKSAKHQVKKAKEEQTKVNPYKVAKETGKSVEDVVREDQKKKAKKQAKKDAEEAKIAKERAKLGAKNATGKDTLPLNHYAVKSKRPISAAGSEYKSGKKAQLEASKAAEREARKNKNAGKHKGKSGKNK